LKAKDSKIDLGVNIGGVKIKNPFFVSSGPTSKHVDQLVKALDAALSKHEEVTYKKEKSAAPRRKEAHAHA
jgi:dihydroorotate dehydrogenase